ncbi:Nramp family divalent metal transporter [Flavobacteriaceae bacterium]|nr:Nramp family divalent metal transporter [Flavobacteriaceae bacterium]MDB4212993.1 Nramp family divalent metal transporter [Flavobacteriaceae bacterium]MDC0623094.1 Nramp family divalent metal transporter [Flavobacteriaceae bacterium]
MISLKNIGPGTVIAAAFIGPGTITMCSIAGTMYGLDLMWALLFSLIMTTVLQLTAAKIGLITQKGLSSNLLDSFDNLVFKYLALALVLSAILIGNTAYEAGNISGGVLGVSSIFGQLSYSYNGFIINLYSLLVGLLAFVILFVGNRRLIERVLIGLVLIMSLAFLTSAIIVKPDFYLIIEGLFIPKLPEGSLLVVIGLIGTTVVPYNIFLHASLVSDKWSSISDLKFVKIDTLLAVVLGGIISISVMVTASSIGDIKIESASDLALGIEPLFGSFSKLIISLGLFAAGLTSSVTAPLAAAYVTCGCMGWKTNVKSKKFRIVWFIVLFMGISFSSLDFKSIEIIKFAQVANGILLPVIAVFLLVLANNKRLLKSQVNGYLFNLITVIIILFTMFIGIKSILSVIGVI